MPRLLPVVPALLLLLFAEWSGNFWSGARAVPAAVGWLALAAVALLARDRARDPFALGGRAAWLPAVVAAVALASLGLSPVARAGMSGVLALPLLLALPAAFAACWRDPRARRTGMAAVSVAVALVAIHAVIARFVLATERAALPLGHHNLLAVWLVLLLPVVLHRALAPGLERALAILAAALALLALGLSGSLAGALGWVVEVAVLVAVARHLLRGRGSSRAARVGAGALAVVGLVALALAAPRLLGILRGADLSTSARLGYAEAALRGFGERPLLGWGPGAGAWLMHEHLRPVPGVHPPYEVVTDAHSLVLDLAFELGLAGVLAVGLALGWFVARRLQTARRAGDESVAAAAWASVAAVLGGVVSLLVSGTFDVAALAVAAAVPLGLGVAVAPQRHPEGEPSPAPRWPLWLVAATVLASVPSRLAHWHYDRFLELGAVPPSTARAASEADARARVDRAAGHLAGAVALDPAFPLYRFRAALESGGAEAAAELRSAALSARGLGLLWLVAGARAGQEGVPGYSRDLERACDLDRLGALAPFVLAVLDPADEAAPERLARALLAEPRLAAAGRLEESGPLVEAALGRLEGLDGVPVGWRAAVVAQTRAAVAAPRGAEPEAVELALEVDALGSTSLSLHAFRRRPAVLPVLSVQLWPERAARITAPSALALRDTAGGVLTEGCRLTG
ncbi:MAG TPA: O-antigen ligase family protein [Thermoanaerobaculia bacterium]|nr:O-antigen ligase family protein [Thermoanaerobaculia bacterium]